MSTNAASAKDIKREMITIDAKGKILGRLSSEIAQILMGKTKVNYVPYLDMGDMVTVTNAKEIKVTGKKASDKKYVRHSGYPGGLRVEAYADLLARRPEQILVHAVKGMLPKNKLGRQMIKKLTVVGGAK